ncbi:ABC transporter permease [Nocardioides sp. cx-173]|uniref:ABC transporter permease n=1 Tax=Nocardioides sp. cx-173 TaxID=2898796 RepID=UPI001E3D753E|nr:ABC transporter permease [Nocardioides sp. cx-173]MCD4523817.1 ABC transporter permease [Nocardioides sp. cx-173]UGB41862.1 ABC transporter permease [Nocardioides sp. cx-173]
MSTTTPTRYAGSRRRVVGLARANALLMTRNRLTLFYGVVLPLLPLLLLLAGERGDTAVGGNAVTTTLLMALLFPVYYNVLSLVVSRRDELVLKRLRTGETRDGELVTALSLPGVVICLVVSLLTVVAGLAAGLPWPTNLPLYLVAVLVCAVLFVAFAFWTAAWTRTAEAAQMTSLPVITLALLGTITPALPQRYAEIVERTPAGALEQLVRLSWFGEDDARTVGSLDTWVAAGEPVLVLLAWTAGAVWLAGRSLRWEPRT